MNLTTVQDFYNCNEIAADRPKLVSYILLWGIVHFQKPLANCRAAMRATVDLLEKQMNSHLLPLLLGRISNLPELNSRYQSEGGTAVVFGVEGRSNAVCKRTSSYKSFVREAIAMRCVHSTL
jgi:hypothetical protein